MSSDTSILILKCGTQHWIDVVQAVETITDKDDPALIIAHANMCAEKGNYVEGSLDRAMEMAYEIEQEFEEEIGIPIEHGILVHRIKRIPDPTEIKELREQPYIFDFLAPLDLVEAFQNSWQNQKGNINGRIRHS